MILLFALIGFFISLAEWLEWAQSTAFLPVFQLCQTIFGRGCFAPPVDAYRQILGIPLSLLGMFYFSGVMLLGTVSLIRVNSWALKTWTFFGFLGSAGALLGVYYLTRTINEFTLLGFVFSAIVFAASLKGFSLHRYSREGFEWFRGPDLAVTLAILSTLLTGLLLFTAWNGRLKDKLLARQDASLPELYDAFHAGKPLFQGPLPEGGIVFGAPAGKKVSIDVVEFVDLECYSCLESLSHLVPFPEDLRGEVRWTILHFPLSGECNPHVSGRPHPRSCDYASLLLRSENRRPDQEILLRRIRYPLEPSRRVIGARSLYSSNSAEAKLLASHIDFGKKLGLTGTPAIYINGKKVGPFVNPKTHVALARYLLGRDHADAGTAAGKTGLSVKVLPPFLGKEDAPLEIVEFASFQCPHSERMNGVLARLIKSGKARVSYKPYPLTPGKAYEFQARVMLALGELWREKKGAEKARLAEALAFFKGDLYRFKNETSAEKIMEGVLADLARMGIDEKSVKDAFNSMKVQNLYAENLADGKKLGITQFPVLFVNGRYYTGPPEGSAIERFAKN